MQNDTILTAATGLEGGLAARGSTCGVVTGGSLGLAAALWPQVQKNGQAGFEALLQTVGQYSSWFEQNYGTCLCRERTGVNFYKPAGQIRYFLGPDLIARCCRHIGGAVNYLHLEAGKELTVKAQEEAPVGTQSHCAPRVLAAIRKQTGVGERDLENLAQVFDGGTGLSGGVCGAAVGAILGINLAMGMDIRNTPYHQTWKPFLHGHYNLFAKARKKKLEPFAVGKEITGAVLEVGAALECARITKKTFQSGRELSTHLDSGACDAVVDAAAKSAVLAIKSLQG